MAEAAAVSSREANHASNSKHAWLGLHNVSDCYRLAVKQQAVDDGLRFAEHICREISYARGDRKRQDLVGDPILDLLAETGENIKWNIKHKREVLKRKY